jgi:hypothetical protein
MPRKIGGYRRLTNNLSGVSRGVSVLDQSSYSYIASGWSGGLDQLQININAVPSIVSNRTPVGFVADPNNCWQFDSLFDATSATVVLVAHAAPNLTDIGNTTAQAVWAGDFTSTAPLTSTGSMVSGGACVVQPYLTTFGTAGTINWSVPNKPYDFAGSGSGTARISGQKIVRGLPIRGGAGNAPAAIYWSLDMLLRMSFIGGTAFFQFDTLSSQSTILSPMSALEYDGIYYWAGADRFLMFNGVMQEVPNNMNINWFFDNLNNNAAQKVFAFKNTRWGEIWWCFPFGNATECTNALIYNVRENSWYDTLLPSNFRTAAHESTTFRSPIMTSADVDVITKSYKLWQHEYGVDAIDGNSVTAINSYFETAVISAPGGSLG